MDQFSDLYVFLYVNDLDDIISRQMFRFANDTNVFGHI